MNAPSTTTAASGTACWSCGKTAGGAHFCAACGKILPLPDGADYFAFFGMPRKLQLDSEALEQRFHQLSWKLHPDNFVRAGEFERNLSLERSSQLNDAYRTLREPVARVEYLLGLAGLRKEGAAKQQAPSELLEEVFELNESLDELREASAADPGGDLASLRERLAAALKSFQSNLEDVDAELADTFSAWDAALDAGASDAARRELLGRMNEILNRRSYVRNLVATVQSALAEA